MKILTTDLPSLLNQTACPDCIPQAYQMNGYDYLYAHDWMGFIQHYGLNVIIAGVLSFTLIHYGNLALIEYYRRKKNENNNG
jgi:ABC-type multidrug transport system permease subunit